MAVLVVSLPALLPFLAIDTAIRHRRMRKDAARASCTVCGASLGREALDRADQWWLAHRAQQGAAHPRVLFRVVRQIQAICPVCDTRYRYRDRAFVLADGPTRPTDPDATPSPAPGR